MKSRRKPDHEAVEVGKGDVEIDVRKQHPRSKNKTVRPDPGTVIRADGDKAKVTIEGRRINKIRHEGVRDSTTVSGMVEVFRNLRSRRSR